MAELSDAIPGAPATSGASIAVVGGGTMGVGIAYVFATAGSHVRLVEPSAERQGLIRDILRQAAESGVTRGKISQAQADAAIRQVVLLSGASELPQGLDLIVETVPENPKLKHAVLSTLSSLFPSLLASNTSSISIDDLAKSVRDPSRFLGMHFFNPVWSLPLVELVRGTETAESALMQAKSFAEGAGKTTIISRDIPGFATSRLDVLSAMEAIRMLEDGVASAEDIDKAMVTAFRHPVGPLRLSDIVGLDVRLDIAKHLAGTLGDRYAPPKLLQDMVARGHLGVKSGRGFYEWTDTRFFVSGNMARTK